jgi:hypothetical protein
VEGAEGEVEDLVFTGLGNGVSGDRRMERERDELRNVRCIRRLVDGRIARACPGEA